MASIHQTSRVSRPGPSAAAIASAVLAMWTLAACTSSPSSDEPAPTGPSPTAAAAMDLKVMEFNIEYGGEQVDFQGVINAIKAGGASVVAIEEGYGNMPKVADGLGWPYYDPRTQIVSKYPILEPSNSDGLFSFVEVMPGRVVAIANVHLPSKRYGPFQIDRNHADAKEVVQVEDAVRVPAVKAPLDAVQVLAAKGIPVFLTGDFNAPSHLDYTDATVGIRKQVKFPIEWPVSELVEKAGLVDSFRQVHPDPVADPGLTWPASRPHVDGYNPGPNGAEADRIDFIYSGGPAKPTASVIVGEQGGDGVDIPSSPWPTDHRATVSTFEVTPASPRALISASPRLVDAGDEATIAFVFGSNSGLTQGSARPHVSITGPETDSLAPVADVRTPLDATDGTLTIPTEGWKAGTYDATLSAGIGDGEEPIAETQFWVQPKGGTPEVSTTQSSYRAGEPITATWNFAPGNRWDWVAVYKLGGNPHVNYYKMWQYTHSTVEGSFTFNDHVHGFPLEPGEYSVYLLQDDSYNKLAAGHFTVTD